MLSNQKADQQTIATDDLLHYSNHYYKSVIEGINSYQQHSYQRDARAGKIIWQQGSAQLLDFSKDYTPKQPLLLIIPSLINRSYIHNLNKELSLVDYLADQGICPLLLNWQDPLPCEYHFSMEHYIDQHLLPAILYIRQHYNNPIILAGHCLGGIVALLAASNCHLTDVLSGLILLATPYNFQLEHYDIARQIIRFGYPKIQDYPVIPPEYIQLLFYYMQPAAYMERFRRLLRNTDHSQIMDHVIAREQWANDGIKMTKPMVEECITLLRQTQEKTHNNKIIYGKHSINPNTLTLPIAHVTAAKDRIVPKPSSDPLAALLPHSHSIKANTGHVSLVASMRAKKELWPNLAEWVKELGLSKQASHRQ